MLTDLPNHPFTLNALPILGLESIVDIGSIQWESVTPESRHAIWRLKLPGDTPGPTSYIIKHYQHTKDQYFDHRFRREERTLHILGRLLPNLVPTIYGGSIVEGHSAFLVLEDLGNQTLHSELENAPAETRRDLIMEAIQSLIAFHHETDVHAPAFRNLCYSTNLDRITSNTMVSRFNVAIDRCLNMTQGVSSSKKEWNTAFYRDIVTPLLTSRRRVIHGSYSPLNICINPKGETKLIDFETLSTGPAELDLAELLSYPMVNLAQEETSFLDQYAHEAYRGKVDANFRTRIQLAAVARCIDYAGTLTLRKSRFERDGLHQLVQSQLHRRNLYLYQAVRRAAEAKVSDTLTKLLESLLRLTDEQT